MTAVKLGSGIDRLWVVCSLLCRPTDQMIELLSRPDVGFRVDGVEEDAAGLCWLKLQSVVNSFHVSLDDHAIQGKYSELRELLLLISAATSAEPRLVELEVRHFWTDQVVAWWPHCWNLVSRLASEILALIGKPALQFESANCVFLVQNASMDNPDVMF